MNKQLREFLRDTVSIIVAALILAVIIRTFVIEGRVVPSESMYPTIQIGDRLMVNKFIYRFKEPQRGDIIVFNPPAYIKSEYDFVKRIVGLPGEKVEVKEGKVFINDQPLNEPYLSEPLNYEFGPVVVPDNDLFVMGDNRNNSYDSHLWDQWLSSDRVIGKAFVLYWPVNHVGLLPRGVSVGK
ncbi:MAG: signal peptidase I [Chitinophagales bacterium]